VAAGGARHLSGCFFFSWRGGGRGKVAAGVGAYQLKIAINQRLMSAIMKEERKEGIKDVLK